MNPPISRLNKCCCQTFLIKLNFFCAMIFDVIICGGGAAGIFTAINIAEKAPGSRVIVLEKTQKLLSKVRISGGGRCNVTNGRTAAGELVKHYPRGEKKLYPLLKEFGPSEMTDWLAKRDVQLKTEADLRVFPVTDQSQTIIDCFLTQCQRYGVKIAQSQEITSFHHDDVWTVHTKAGDTFKATKLVIATGSSTRSWKMIEKAPLKISELAPSLFTFNIKDPRLTDLPGVAFANCEVKIAGTKLVERGPVLITHWGLSGPATLKLSAWGARILQSKNYQFDIIVNFVEGSSSEEFRASLMAIKSTQGAKKLVNCIPEGIPKRYWARLVDYCEIPPNMTAGQLNKKQLNKLTEECTQALFQVTGKSTFKDEFVTCGGVALSQVNLKTMESKQYPGLYFGGEVLDIDGITGGFNFQACWAAGWAISEALKNEI